MKVRNGRRPLVGEVDDQLLDSQSGWQGWGQPLLATKSEKFSLHPPPTDGSGNVLGINTCPINVIVISINN